MGFTDVMTHRGAKYQNKQYSSKTELMIPHIEDQSPHCIGTWTLIDKIASCGRHMRASCTCSFCGSPSLREALSSFSSCESGVP